jgi:hypothetical protein
MSSALFTRVRAMVCAAILTASLVGIAAAPAMAANTRITYFGSAACSGSSCPSTVPASASAYAYPYGTGGGFTGSGHPIAGQNSFTPVTAGSSTATDIVITNLASSTLTQVHVSGGSQAPTTINTDSVPATPVSSDQAPCQADGTCLPSLPDGLHYQAVYVVSKPSALAVSCNLSDELLDETGAKTGLFGGLLCSIGNLSKNASLTLRVVISATDTATTTPLEPWFALQLKEGSSSTGANSDVFLTYGLLSVAPRSCGAISNFFLETQPISLSNPLQCEQTTKVDAAAIPKGTLVTVGTKLSTWCVGNVSCFGDLSTSSILAGASIPGGVTWSITWSASLVPSGGPKGAIHFLDAYPTNPNAYETITFKTKDQCGTTKVKMCWLTFTANPDGSYSTQIWTPTNGSIRG